MNMILLRDKNVKIKNKYQNNVNKAACYYFNIFLSQNSLLFLNNNVSFKFILV